jgi:hypothetical protein
VGNNLIEGSLKQVVAFLEQLSTTDNERKEEWRRHVDAMWKRRQGI